MPNRGRLQSLVQGALLEDCIFGHRFGELHLDV